MRAWFRIFSAGQVVHNLHDVFHRAGIDLYTPDEPLSGPGLAIVNEFDPRLRNFLQEARQAGVVRIIAINLPADHASGPATWSLLRAGVCDVLNWDRPDQTACAVAARLARWQIVDTLVTSSEVQNTLVGQSPVALSVLRQLVE
ncbi:MAG: hypothetical protein OEY60_10630, partial [Nitrospira sp.]|nr:hypothetical protein [Nitrospira sp.]